MFIYVTLMCYSFLVLGYFKYGSRDEESRSQYYPDFIKPVRLSFLSDGYEGEDEARGGHTQEQEWSKHLVAVADGSVRVADALQVQLKSRNLATNWILVSGGLTLTFIIKYVLHYYTILSCTYLLYILLLLRLYPE